jgi:hypothetical protein
MTLSSSVHLQALDLSPRDSSQNQRKAFKTGLAVLLTVVFGGSFAAGFCEAQTAVEIELRPDLVIGDESGVYFGGPLRLAVNSKGVIYVGDWMNTNIQVFSPDGDLLEVIGRRGQGPDEFSSIHSVSIGRNDSLYVFDGNASRVSVYAPGEQHTLAYTLRVATIEGQGHPTDLMVPNDPSTGFLFRFNQQGPGTLRVHKVDRDGSVTPRPILEGRSSEAVASVASVAGGGASVVRTSPLFGLKGMVGLMPADELYYAWSEEIDLTFYDLTGKWVGVFRADSPRIPVTARDIAHELEGASEMRREALKNSTHPKTKPALHTVIVDDNSWIWTGRYTTDPKTSEWWVTLEKGGGDSAIFSLPADVELLVVRNGHVYAASVDDAGAPTVVRYVINTEGIEDLHYSAKARIKTMRR